MSEVDIATSAFRALGFAAFVVFVAVMFLTSLEGSG